MNSNKDSLFLALAKRMGPAPTSCLAASKLPVEVSKTSRRAAQLMVGSVGNSESVAKVALSLNRLEQLASLARKKSTSNG